MSQLGPKLAVAAIDTRSSRTRERIIPEKLMDSMLDRVRNLPYSVKHLLFVSAVPVQYVDMQFMEKLIGTAEGNGFLKKTGVFLILFVWDAHTHTHTHTCVYTFAL
jgi:hypothetical protein